MKAYRFPLIGSVLVLILITMTPIRLTQAHADLRRSDPAAGAVLDRAPMEVSAWFSSPLSTGSKLSVFDAQFQAVDGGETFIDASDATRMRVELVPLSPGRYTVNWRAAAVDGHVSSGSYDFVVREANALLPLLITVGAGGLMILVGITILALRRSRRRRSLPVVRRP